MRNHFSKRASERGSALIFYTLALPVLLMVASLAVDLTTMYIAQAQLQTAVDGAARGAVRLLNTTANTTEIAAEFLKANLPNGYWFTSNLKSTNISLTTTGTQHTVNVTATVDVPLTFMQIIGLKTTTVAATGNASEWDLTPCTLTYPYGTAPALSSVLFNESTLMVGYGPTFVKPHGTIMAWYTDEHPVTLGVYKVNVKTSSGTTTTDYTFTDFTGSLSAVNPTGPLPVGTTALTGDQAGTDTATWTSAYGFVDKGRPLWPSLFITDITFNDTDVSGDWQQGGTTAVPPSAVYGSWKGAVRLVDYTHLPSGAPKGTPTVTVTPDADPKTKNMWSGVPDTPPGGFPSCDGFCSEIVWNIDNLKLKPGHTYRMQFIIHDGDQNKSGGDTGQGCAVATY